MTKQEIETAYIQHDKLLHKLSHQCASRCGRPEEEIYGQACYLFMTAINSYPTDKPHYKLTQWITCVVRNGLIDWAYKYDLPGDPETTPELTTSIPDPCKSLMVKEWLAGLSAECREVTTIILNGPAEVLGLGTRMIVPKAVRGALRHHLRAKGWSWPKIWDTIRTMKEEVAKI